MTKINEKFCGNCCWFVFEDCDGNGMCMPDYPVGFQSCVDSGVFCDFVSRENMRHHMAVLLQFNRYWKDKYLHFPSLYKMPKPSEVSRAIEFSVRYMKVFSEL